MSQCSAYKFTAKLSRANRQIAKAIHDTNGRQTHTKSKLVLLQVALQLVRMNPEPTCSARSINASPALACCRLLSIIG